MVKKEKLQEDSTEIIPIGQATAESAARKEIKNLKEENRSIKLIMTGVIIVLFIGFCTIFLMAADIVINTWRSKASSYESLIETIRSQEKIIEENKNERTEIKVLLEEIKGEMESQNN